MNYVCLKLTTGEHVVGVLDTTCEEFITIENPVCLEYGFDNDANLGIKFMLYMPYSDETVYTFQRKYVILESNLSEKIQKYYNAFILKEFGDENIDKAKLN